MVEGLYNTIVFRLWMPYVWKTSYPHIRHIYSHIGVKHLEVGTLGVYLLANVLKMRGKKATVITMAEDDDTAFHRIHIKGQHIRRYKGGLDSIHQLPPASQDSIALPFVLENNPMAKKEKLQQLIKLKGLLKPQGIIFGVSMLEHGENQDNDISKDELHRHLSEHFRKCSVQTSGLCTIFWADIG